MEKTINYMGPVNNLGYGIASKNILYQLDPHVSLTYFPIGNPEEYDQDKVNVLRKAIARQDKVGVSDYGLKVWHEFALAERPPCKKFIGFPIFEVDILPERSVYQIRSCDYIFVASKWAKTVIENSFKEYNMTIPTTDGKDFINVVPLGVDLDTFSAREPVKNDKCRFFNCGKWEIRKGHDILLKAFQEAFPNQLDVSLNMMCTNIFPQAKKFSDAMEDMYSSDIRVQFIDRVNTSQEVANVMASMDCGVFPSRAEGWNLELLEMMAMNKRVIATNYSAHTEFCDKENCKLINIENLTQAYDGLWFDGSKKWADIGPKQISQLAKAMKDTYLEWKTNGVLTNENGVSTAQSFNWENTCNKILEFTKD